MRAIMVIDERDVRLVLNVAKFFKYQNCSFVEVYRVLDGDVVLVRGIDCYLGTLRDLLEVMCLPTPEGTRCTVRDVYTGRTVECKPEDLWEILSNMVS
jgi:hypothetical protein